MKVGFVDIEVNSSEGIPYLTQLVTLQYDTYTQEEVKTNLYIKLPEGVEISKEMQECNGITQELLDEKWWEWNDEKIKTEHPHKFVKL